MKRVALFPIPDCVTFPGTSFPLHVFEPRYRSMIQYCLENDTFLAVCHTQKIIRESKPNQTLEESLQSNQATYRPYNVFSAGPCELIETLEDGRMIINVHLQKRYNATKEIQTLPFSLWECEEYVDQQGEHDTSEAEEIKQKIIHRICSLMHQNSELTTLLNSNDWTSKDPTAFSFEFFSLLRFPGDVLQSILEKRSTIERLKETLNLLNAIK